VLLIGLNEEVKHCIFLETSRLSCKDLVFISNL